MAKTTRTKKKIQAATKTKSSHKGSLNGAASKAKPGKQVTHPDARRKTSPRVMPRPDELHSLYQRYTAGSSFDDHDKAFYFVLDVGGLSRAKQLVAHVEEVLAELEEFRG
jgi:hypothetical protein